jgi:putative restriction endonuclease
VQPFFLPKSKWIPAPPDWKPNIVQGKTYDRKCAITSEKVLPVLEAAHIRPYVEAGPHQVDNGILLRSDLHILFDRGYLTVDPDLRLQVSRRIHDEFHNGRAYYALHGSHVREPNRPEYRPSPEFLSWHNEEVFRD